jgi:hypothetical protein
MPHTLRGVMIISGDFENGRANVFRLLALTDTTPKEESGRSISEQGDGVDGRAGGVVKWERAYAQHELPAI